MPARMWLFNPEVICHQELMVYCKNTLNRKFLGLGSMCTIMWVFNPEAVLTPLMAHYEKTSSCIEVLRVRLQCLQGCGCSIRRQF